MAYQTKTTTSYGQRLSGSLKGIGGGLLMFVAGTILLFWNEGNFVKTKKSINEAQSVVVKVDDVSFPNPDLNGKLIFGVSKTLTDDILNDELFNVSVNAIKLSRTVEYFQWVEQSKKETRDKIGGGQETVTTYTYKKDWVSSPVNSSNFHDPEYQSSNSVITTIEDKNVVADNVTWGAYTLPPFLKNAIKGTTPVAIQLSEQNKAEWEKALKPAILAAEVLSSAAETDNSAEQGNTEANQSNGYIHESNNVVYFGANPSSPAIGDIRVSVTHTPPGGDLSVIAQVQGNTFTQYTAKNGRDFWSVENGIVSAEQMFQDEHTSNSIWTWIFRVIGLFLIIGGLKSILAILPALFKVLPFLGNIVGAGVGLVCSVLGFAWSLVIVAIAWLTYRPIIAIIFLIIAGGGIWFLKKKNGEKETGIN